jgi:ferredoxin, 2Fe-2S
MLRMIIVDRAGRESTVDVREGLTLLENIHNAGFGEVLALCGGSCSCATCHVFVGDDGIEKVGAAAGDESELLESSLHREPESRLSCQINVTAELDGLRVTIAPEE